MGHFEITGKRTVGGVHRVPGNKNAALPMIAATLLTSEPVTLENVPAIADVDSMLECAKRFGAEVVRNLEAGTVTVCAKRLRTARLRRPHVHVPAPQFVAQQIGGQAA